MGPRELYDTIDSTQDRAAELARAGAPAGTRVVARSQRRGRGRLDHVWWSPPGAGVYLSLIVPAPPPPRTLLALAIGSELLTTVRRKTGVAPVLKWPNDLLVVNGGGPPRKISGILIDEVHSPTLGVAEIVGIGVNVRSRSASAPAELRDRVAALEDWVHPPPELDEVEEWMVTAALRASDRLGTPAEAAQVLEECRSVLYGVGCEVRWDGSPAGRIVGVGPEGELWVEQGGERIAIRTGDVEVSR